MKWVSDIIGGKVLIKGLDHIALIVSDMDRAIEFYTAVLGLKLIKDGRPEGGMKKTFVGTGNRAILALTEDKERRRLQSGSVGGVNHVAFCVDDVATTKIRQVDKLAKQYEHPLKCILEVEAGGEE